FLPLWALALFMMYWYQVPAAIVGLGHTITVTDFNFFFALTFPVTFLALMLVFVGIIDIFEYKIGKKSKAMLLIWFLSAIAFFSYYFITREGIIDTYLLPLGGNMIFYLPMRALIILVIWKRLSGAANRNLYMTIGSVLIVMESILGIIRNSLVIENILIWPPQFWYAVLSSSKFFFVTQSLSIILFVAGFYLLHIAYYRTRDHIGDVKTPHIAGKIE
ncbi:MAG: hypothetical protein AAB655_02520, partial [Patescibacteria group bacterium]